MKSLLILFMTLISMSAYADQCPGFTMQFVQVERVADAKIRLQTDDFDKNKDTIHSLIQYKYVSTGRTGEVIEKNTLATWTPSNADIGSVKGIYQPDTVREFFKIPLTDFVIDITGFEDVADLEKCPVLPETIARNNFPNSTKKQALGAIDRFINLMNNYQDTRKSMAGLDSLYTERDDILVRLADIRALISVTD